MSFNKHTQVSLMSSKKRGAISNYNFPSHPGTISELRQSIDKPSMSSPINNETLLLEQKIDQLTLKVLDLQSAIQGMQNALEHLIMKIGSNIKVTSQAVTPSAPATSQPLIGKMYPQF